MPKSSVFVGKFQQLPLLYARRVTFKKKEQRAEAPFTKNRNISCHFCFNIQCCFRIESHGAEMRIYCRECSIVFYYYHKNIKHQSTNNLRAITSTLNLRPDREFKIIESLALQIEGNRSVPVALLITSSTPVCGGLFLK